MQLQRIFRWLLSSGVLVAPMVTAAPLGVSLSRDIVKQVIADTATHAQEIAQDSLDTGQGEVAKFNELNQIAQIVSQLVQQARLEPIQTSAALTTMAVEKHDVSHTKSLIAEVKTEVEVLLDQLEKPAESTSSMGFASLLSANDFQEASTYQSYEGLAFGDSRNRVKNGFWTSLKTSSATLEAKDDLLGFDAHGESFTAGMENSSLIPGVLFGAAVTMGNSKVTDEDSQKKTGIRSLTGSLYGAWKFNNKFIEGGVSLGRARNDMRRMATVASDTGYLESQFYASTVHARLLAGSIYNLTPSWTLTPLVELNYNRVGFDSYTEEWDSDCSGGCINPSTERQPDSQSTMEGGLGFNIAGNLGSETVRLVPFVSVMGYYNFRRDESSMQAVYMTGIDQMSVTASEMGRGRLRLSFGMSLILDDRFRMDLGVIHNQMKGYKGDSANLKIRYSF